MSSPVTPSPYLEPLGTPIVDVSARPIRLPFANPIVTPNYVIDSIYGVAVRVADLDGVAGDAYLWCVNEPQVKILLATVAHVAGRVRGASPDALGSMHAGMRNDINFIGLKGAAVFGLSALDMAVHDLRCRRLGVSLSSLLGRVHDRVPVYWSGLMLTETDEELVAETQDLVERGFTACKIRVGRNTIERDTQRIRLVRENTPANLVLMLDAVQYYTPYEAVEASRRFAEFSPVWLEEPVVHNDYEGLAHVVAHSAVPIASGENEYLPEGVKQLAQTGLAYAVVDLERVGGISGWVSATGHLAATRTQLTPHVYPHISTQLMSVAPARPSWVEYMTWWDELMTYELDISDGLVTVPDVVGTGVDFDPAAINRFSLGEWVKL